MLESEWLLSNDPVAMLKSLEVSKTTMQRLWNMVHYNIVSNRKLRLFATACFFSPDDAGHIDSLDELEKDAEDFDASELAMAWARQGVRPTNEKADLLREIVGNPFTAQFLCCSVKGGRHLPLDNKCPGCGPILAWNDGTVPRMAQSIYEERAFDRMPILADALEEAGCDNEAILQHCRGGGPHVRGCWVLDLLLGKE